MKTTTPLLVIVSGPAATGKTSLAKNLAEKKSIPAICKDDIKESLFDSLGYETPDWVERLEIATYDLLFYIALTMLKASTSLIIESDVTPYFNEERINKIREQCDFRIVQIACRTEGETLVKRFHERMNSGTQHPGHFEAYYLEKFEEFRESLQKGYSNTLDVDSDVIIVDTTDFAKIDYGQLLGKIII